MALHLSEWLVLFYGTIQSALFTLLAVYATSMNFTILEISIVTFLLAVSGAIAQYPVGKISDIYDRRKVIIFQLFVLLYSLLFQFLLLDKCIYLVVLLPVKIYFIFFYSFFFCSLPMFSLILAHTNDYIPKEKICCRGCWLTICFWIGSYEWAIFMLYFYGYSWSKWIFYISICISFDNWFFWNF